MNKLQDVYKVVSNNRICPKFYLLKINASPILKRIRPGQFVHIHVAEDEGVFLRRPFSVYRAKEYLEILYEVVGEGTQILSKKRKGDDIDVLGPLGNPFSLPPDGVRQVVMVAGGAGIAPFLILSDVLKRRKVKLVLLYGGRSKDDVYSLKEFRRNGCEIFVSTDDGSAGIKGQVTELFSQIKLDAKEAFVYTCGPKGMMAAVQKFVRRYHLHGEAACEENMACGLGACLGCSIPTKSGYKTVCYDGPIFDLDEVVLE